MAFIPLKKLDGKEMSLPIASAGSLVKGSLAKMSSGYLVVGAAGDNEVEYVSNETAAGNGTNGGVKANVTVIDETIQFQALCDTTPVQASHVGLDVDIGTAGASLDLTGTTDKVFHIDAIYSAADKLVIGHFNKPGLA